MKIDKLVGELVEFAKANNKQTINKEELKLFLINHNLNSAIYPHILSSYLRTLFAIMEQRGLGRFDRAKKVFIFNKGGEDGKK